MSLTTSLAAWRRTQTTLPSLEQITAIVLHVAEVLQSLHEQGIAYQNINSSTVVVSTQDGAINAVSLQVKATPTQEDTITFGRSFPINSQPRYMAPEQWEGQAVPATDQYALAVIAYELLAGQPPFQGPPVRLIQLHLEEPPPMASTFSTRVSPALDMVLLNALAKRPEDRFPSVSAFARAFEQAIQQPASLIVSVPREAIDGSLRAILSISSAEALTGTLRTITIPGGQRLTVTVPQAASTGYVIRLENPTSRVASGRVADTILLTIVVSETETHPSDDLSAKTHRKVPSGALSADLESPSHPAPTPVAARDSLLPVAAATPVAVDSIPEIAATDAASISPQSQQENPAVALQKAMEVLTPHISEFSAPTTLRSGSVKQGTAGTFTRMRNAFFKQGPLTIGVVALLVLIAISLFFWLQLDTTVAFPYPPGRGSLVMRDALRDNSTGYNWPDKISVAGGNCQFAQEKYYVSMTQANAFHYCIAGATDFSNFAYEVNMTIIQGDGGGIIFRAAGTSGRFYYFQVTRDGSYVLSLYKDSLGVHAQKLASGRVAAVYTGLNITNRLAVVAQGDMVSLYINNQNILRIKNDAYGDGQLGVAANSDANVAFSSAQVWTF